MIQAQEVRVGDAFRCDGEVGRVVRVQGALDGVTLIRDHRGRIAVRNVATGRLSYLPEQMLLSMPRAVVDKTEAMPNGPMSESQRDDVLRVLTAMTRGGYPEHAHVVRVMWYAHDAMQAAIAALEPGWQPIETAPKDGTWVLLQGRGKRGPWALPVIGVWSSYAECWQDYESRVEEPTHWMPLPEPPR